MIVSKQSQDGTCRSRDGAVGGPEYCGLISGRGKRSISSSTDQSGSGTHPVS